MKYNSILSILALVVFIASCGPSAFLQKGDDAYDRLEYQSAIDYYEKALEKTDDSQATERLADSYRHTNQFEEAEQWYAKAVQNPQADPEVKYHYASILLANGKTEEARQWANDYVAARPNDSKGIALVQAVNSQDDLSTPMNNYSIETVPFNSPGSDFAPAFWKGELIFVSDRNGKTDPWTQRSYQDLFVTENGLLNVSSLPGNLGGDFHTSAATVAPDGQQMYFTRSQPRKAKGRDNVVRSSIYSARLNNGQWQEGEPFPYNSPDYSNMHPAISPDGKMLVFASDRDGVGGRDLFVCMDQGGRWGPPQNFNAPVNTSGNECYPYFGQDGTLYFASDGLPGLGGYDLFYTRYENGFWVSPEHLGGEINSSKDDISLITKDGLDSGFFASNRSSVDGTDDIFRFTRVQGAISLNGIVVDEFTSIPLPNVVVTVTNQNTGIEQTAVTSNDGRFSFALEPDSRYTVSGLLNNIGTSRATVITYDQKEDEPQFVKLTHNDPRFTLNGTALSRTTQSPVAGVKVRLYNITSNEETIAVSDAEGNFSFQLTQNSEFQISGEKDGYFTSISEATTKGLNRSTTLFVKLYLTIEEIVLDHEIILDGATIGNVEFNDILYDFDDHRIRPDAAIELDKLVDILANTPSINIELGAHTDSRGRSSYNMELSQRRADAAVEYIISRGISADRIRAQGYGESRLTNRCGDGVRCSEEEHQENRRTEIKILSF